MILIAAVFHPDMQQGSHKNWERKFHDFSMTFNPIP